MKPEIKILGVDDGFFARKSGSRVLVVGVVVRGNDEVEGVLSTTVGQDGDDSTRQLASMVRESRHAKQLKAIMLNSTMLGGFNVVDITELNRECRIPVIAIMRTRPDTAAAERALEKVAGAAQKRARMKSAGAVHHYRKLFFQAAGIAAHEAQEIIDVAMRKSNIPEPVRIAHLIASGVTLGESTRRA